MALRPFSLDFWRRLAGFAGFAGRRLLEGRCLETAGSLTFTTLLAIVPLFTIALTLFSAFPMFGDYSSKFKSFILTNLVPDASGKVIGVYMHQFSENAEQLTALGMISLAATALMLMFTIEQTLNQIWGVTRSRNLLSRTLIYWATLTLGPVMIGLSFSLATWLSGELPGDLTGIGLSLLKLGPWLMIFMSMWLLFLVVPNCYVPGSHALIAALGTTAALDLMKWLFGLYIKQFGTFKLVYGAFASFPIFLLWLYVSWVIVLGGAVLSASLSYWHNDAWHWPRKRGTRFEQALLLLLALEQARQSGEILHINTLRQRVGLGIDAANQLLESMAGRKWVEASRDGRWLLAIELERLRLLDVFEQVQTPLWVAREQALESCIARLREDLDMTLAEYVAKRQPQAQPAASALLTSSAESSPT